MNVGVTGHRYLRNTSALSAGVVLALGRIGVSAPGRLLTVVSPLAEGADRLVAEVVLGQPGARLVVPLPLPRSEYMKDFATEGSRTEFLQLLEQAHQVVLLPPAASRVAAYRAAGLYVLGRSDILIALWDGRPPQGPGGGTGEIVASALSTAKPVCHIWTGNASPDGWMRTDVGERHGQLRWLNFE